MAIRDVMPNMCPAIFTQLRGDGLAVGRSAVRQRSLCPAQRFKHPFTRISAWQSFSPGPLLEGFIHIRVQQRSPAFLVFRPKLTHINVI